ncbi:retrovirus-related pol polyprotein from transposon TNT 1-94 [Tanacetum coccineum]
MNSNSQDGSEEDVDKEEEVEAFNLMARNFYKFFRKGNRFGQGNRFVNGSNRFSKGHGNSFGNKSGERFKPKGACYNCGIEGHFASKCRKSKENKDFFRGAWSDSEDGNKHQNDATYLMAIDSQEAYDDGHVMFGSNLKGKVISGGNITHDSITITNVDRVSGLAFNLISVGPFTSQSREIAERMHRKLRKMSYAMLDEQSIPQNFWCHALDEATYIFNRVYI